MTTPEEASATVLSRREARLAAAAEELARTQASTPDAVRRPAGPSEGRRSRRASSETITAAAGEPVTIEVSVQAGEEADSAAGIAVLEPAPLPAGPEDGVEKAPTASVAASLVGAPRPHAQRGGRRAAASFSDSIEKPAGGRRARVATPTTAEAGDTTLLPAVPVEPSLPKAVSRRTLRTTGLPAPTESPKPGTDAADAPTPPKAGTRRSRRGDIAKGTFSVVAMLFAAGIAVATTMPASAFNAAPGGAAETVLADIAPTVARQELTTNAGAAGSSILRDDYSVRDVAALKAAGLRVANTFTNNPNSAIQWPFPVGVPISDGFGPRESPGGIGSTDHKGVDFTPGQGTDIHVVADGVVSKVVRSDGGGLGVYVIVDHVVDGEKVTSVYGHMLTGSIEVDEGQVLKVGEVVGRVGNTGTSTGAHLHLEIRLNGTTAVDPYAWLSARVL